MFLKILFYKMCLNHRTSIVTDGDMKKVTYLTKSVTASAFSFLIGKAKKPLRPQR